MPDHDRRRDLFAAIDRTTRWMYVEHKSARPASGFFLRLIDTAPFTIAQNSIEFTDRFRATGQRQFKRHIHIYKYQ